MSRTGYTQLLWNPCGKNFCWTSGGTCYARVLVGVLLNLEGRILPRCHILAL